MICFGWSVRVMKLFRRKNPKPGVDREDALNCRPVKPDGVQETLLKSGYVLLASRRPMRPWMEGMVRRLGGRPEEAPLRKTELDEMGTWVWSLMDGNRSVGDIIKVFSEHYQLHPKEAEVAVTQFIRLLGNKGLIGLK